MRSIFAEYGMTVISCITVAVALVLYGYLLNSPHGLVFLYSTDRIYENDLLTESDINTNSDVYDRVDAVSNIARDSYKPSFVVVGASTSDYVIPVPSGVLDGSESTVTSGYTYEDIIKMFNVGDKLKLSLWNGSTYVNQELPADDVEVVITKYSPTSNGVHGEYKLQEVDSVDKFGNYLRDSEGNIIQQTQIAYTSSTYTRDNISDFYINWDEEARYKVIFRYKQGTLKAEYSAMFTNKMRPATSIYEEVYESWRTEEIWDDDGSSE